MKSRLHIIVFIFCGIICFPGTVHGNATDNDKEVITFSIIGTIGVEILIAIIAYFVWKKCKAKKAGRSSKEHNLHGHDNAAFLQNADGSAVEKGLGNYTKKNEYNKKLHSPSHSGSPNEKSWNSLPKVQFAGANLDRHGSYASLDNNINSQDPEIVSVNLQSQDFIGLGFNISGSMRDGIFVSEVHNRGPAIESGLLKVGDRILSVTISFENMVFEDALTILSYASPYPVNICLQKQKTRVSYKANNFEMQLNHPFFRSQSMDTLNRLRKETLPKRSYSELKTDNKKISSSFKQPSFLKDIQASDPQLYSTNNGYDEMKLELPVFTQVSDFVVHQPPTDTPAPVKEEASIETSSSRLESGTNLNNSIHLREPYKVYLLESTDSAETLESTPKPGYSAKFPLFNSDDSISKLNEKMDIHFSNCDREFEDLKQKADDDNFNLNLNLDTERKSGTISPSSEAEFESLEKEMDLTSNFGDIFGKFSELNLSFGDFPGKEIGTKEDTAWTTDISSSTNSNIFLTAEGSSELMTESNVDVSKKEDVTDPFKPILSEEPVIRITNNSELESSKVDYSLPFEKQTAFDDDETRQSWYENIIPKSSKEETIDSSSSSSDIKEQSVGEVGLDKQDSGNESADNIKATEESRLLTTPNFEANFQDSLLTDSIPSVENTFYSVDSKIHESIPDILKESSSLAKPEVELNHADSLLSLTTDDAGSSLLEPELVPNETSASSLEPKVTSEDIRASLSKYRIEPPSTVDTPILSLERETDRTESFNPREKISTIDVDPVSIIGATKSSFLKYEIRKEETDSSLLKQESDTESSDSGPMEYEVTTDDIEVSLLKTSELSAEHIDPVVPDPVIPNPVIPDLDLKAGDAVSAVLNTEINADKSPLSLLQQPEAETVVEPSENTEPVPNVTVNVSPLERSLLFTEPIKLHDKEEEKSPAGEKSALEISKQDSDEDTDHGHEASSPFETPEKQTEQHSVILTPYRHSLTTFSLKDISLDSEDSVDGVSKNVHNSLADDSRSENEEVTEDNASPVSINQQELSFTQPILKQEILPPTMNLDLSVDADSKEPDIPQTDSNVLAKSSPEESSLDSESEEQRSDETTDKNGESTFFKVPLFRRSQQNSLSSNSSDSEDEDVNKKGLGDGFPSQPLKVETLYKSTTVSARSSDSSSDKDYESHTPSKEADKPQRDSTTPPPSLNLPNDSETEEAEENQDKKDEAFFEMTEDELSTDTQSLSPKSAVTRAVSYDGGFVTSDDSDLSKPRSNSLKPETQTPDSEDNDMDWSGKRLVRTEPFSQLPDSDQVWTGTDRTENNKSKSDSDSDTHNDPQFDVYRPLENRTHHSLSDSTSSISSTETKTNGERGNDSETSLELNLDHPFSETNHKTELLLPRAEEDKKLVRTNYEGHGAFTVTFSAQNDTDA